MQYGIPNFAGTLASSMVAKITEPLIDIIYTQLRDIILAKGYTPVKSRSNGTWWSSQVKSACHSRGMAGSNLESITAVHR